MRRVVVRYDADTSVLPVVVEVGDDGIVPDFPSGWSIDESADPSQVEADVAEAQANAAAQSAKNPAPIRFASDAAAEQDTAAAAPSKSAPATAQPTPAAPTTAPAEPATTEGN